MLFDYLFNTIRLKFEDFYSPTILKRNDEQIVNQIQYLKQYGQNESDKVKLRKLQKGLAGENKVLYELEHSNIGMFVLHGVHVGDAQIDFVVVTHGWIYIIECKSYNCDWKITKTGKFETSRNGITKIYKSPLEQAKQHLEAVKKRWLKRHGKAVHILFSNEFDKNWYKPLVVIANTESKIDISEAPKEYRDKIVRADELISYLKRDLKRYYKREPILSKKQMHDIAKSFMAAESEYQEEKRKNKKTHTSDIGSTANALSYQEASSLFKRNLRQFVANQAMKESREPDDILSLREIQIICLHNFYNPEDELKRLPISEEKKQKYAKGIIAAYTDAFGKTK